MKVCETHSEVRLFSKCLNIFGLRSSNFWYTVQLYNQLNIGFDLLTRFGEENISDQTDPWSKCQISAVKCF